MTDYRRNFIAGGSFLFNLAERRLRLLTRHIEALRGAFRETRRRHPSTIDAMVVLPDHLRTLPERASGARHPCALSLERAGSFSKTRA